MARCEECIHEKVCLHKANIQTDTYAYMGVNYDTESCKHFTPTADVAPKSEVEKQKLEIWRLNGEVERLEKENETLTIQRNAWYLTVTRVTEDFQNARAEVERLRKALDEYEETSGLKQAKAEVAREIFVEIANIMVLQHGFNEKHIVAHIDFELLKELKKKYTGRE